MWAKTIESHCFLKRLNFILTANILYEYDTVNWSSKQSIFSALNTVKNRFVTFTKFIWWKTIGEIHQKIWRLSPNVWSHRPKVVSVYHKIILRCLSQKIFCDSLTLCIYITFCHLTKRDSWGSIARYSCCRPCHW